MPVGRCWLIAALLVIVASLCAPAATFTVTTTNDSGAGSLRQAMLDANAAAGLDTIAFNIADATRTIVPATVLPPIVSPVIIDATTQPGFAGVPIVEISGTSIAGAGNDGLKIWAGGTIIRGLVINRFSGDGIEIATNGNNFIEGCRIGTGLSGTNDLGNTFSGIFITNSAHNVIGGASAAQQNVISGNNQHGVHIGGTNSFNNVVLRNLIGLGATGSNIVANSLNGVLIFQSRSNVIGNVSAAAGNVISGNTQNGVRIENTNAWGNLVLGNLIGLEITGTTNRANGNNGVYLFNAPSNSVGNATATAANIISGNAQAGVRIEGAPASANVVQGNLIGLDVSGQLDRGNTQDGIIVINAPGSILGGATAGAGNLISGNNDDGIELQNIATAFSVVRGNFIGTTASNPALALGNGGHGLQITSNARTNTIGGTGAGEGNVIAFNVGDGIFVNAGTNNAFRANLIYANTGLGIDLSANGVTTNDVNDADAGPNQLQNFPILSAVTNSVSGTEIRGTFQGAASQLINLDFFANVQCDPTGNGEGQTYLGSGTVTTDGAGNGSFTVALAATTLAGRYITATATDALGNTSEFSPCLASVSTKPGQSYTVINTNDTGAGSLRQAILNANATINSGDTITFNIPGVGVQAIRLASMLPLIIDPVTIDGTTQPGASCPVSATAFDGTLLVRIDGTNLPANSHGLRFNIGGNTVRGLQIVSFTGDGLQFSNAANNVVECNLLGVDETSADRGNGTGVALFNSSATSIGGSTPAKRNVISGNAVAGIRLLTGSSGVSIQGNLIGLNLTGTTNRANDDGIVVSASSGNSIGGSAAGARNVISGNAVGLNFLNATNNLVLGNYIGTGASGTFRVANTADGIDLDTLSTRNTVGGLTAAEGNLISGNNSDGIELAGAAMANQILGNRIGTDVTGTSALANNGHGVNLSSASTNQIGGLAAGAGNLIAFNGADGVNVATASTNNAIRGNRLFANGAAVTDLGIDLGANGVLANDVGDGDVGANRSQNFPVLTTATNSGSGTEIRGTLSSGTNTSYGLDFFSNFACDVSGNGEGQVYLGSGSVTTDASGNGSFVVTLPATTLTGRYFTATATDPLGNTSEFGPCLFAQSTVAGVTFVVVNTNNAGPGSLRQAILDANVLINGGDRITFNIPGTGVRVISPTNALPAITDPVTIDGYTQPGATTNSATASFNGNLLIQLDGVTAGAAVDGLRLAAGPSTVRGLVITRFLGDGIEIATNGNSVVEGCLLGIDMTNTNRPNGAAGVRVFNTPGNRIGGATPGARNVISGNGGFGVHLLSVGASNNVVLGNFIGLDLTGALDRGNANDGVYIEDAPSNRVGGLTVAERNVVSGNAGDGVTIFTAGAVGNQVLGNFIGTDATGGLAVGNGANGVLITTSASGSIIGGPGAGAGNRIAFNSGDGVFVGGGTNNAIRGNAIFANGTAAAELGLDLGTSGVTANDLNDIDAGANQLQNFPSLTSATVNVGSVQINGTLQSTPSTSFLIDFYVNPACDTSGNGEGQIYLGSSVAATDGSGNAVIAASLPHTLTNRFLTATATDPFGNTSEFSPCLRAGSTVPAVTFTVINTSNAGPGSLRQAIFDNNSTAHSAANTIRFAIPGAGLQTLVLTNPLPVITESVVIDGLTQPGASANTLALGHNANLLIRLSGTNAGPSTDGLRFASGGNTVRGLVIVGFGGDGLELTSTGSVSRIEGCLIGIDVDATDHGNSGDGLFVNGSANNIIGGTTPAARNVISGNNGRGVHLSGTGATANVVLGNCIGTDLAGTARVGNGGDGVAILSAAFNTIGGTAIGARNVISGNFIDGVEVSGLGATNNVIAGNYIGTDATGSFAVLNRDNGVYITGVPGNIVGGTAAGAGNVLSGNGGYGVALTAAGCANSVVQGNRIGTDVSGTLDVHNSLGGVQITTAHDNSIGGTAAGAANIIAFNFGDGIFISAAGATNNAVRANLIFANTGLGLDLENNGVSLNDVGDGDAGGNRLQNYPILLAATNNVGSVTVAGTLSSGTNQTYALDFFSSPACDATGNGEGQTYLGFANVTTDASGNVTFLATLPGVALIGRQVTATATDAFGNTSEFSPCVRGESSLAPQTFTVINTNDSGAGSLRAALIANNAAVNSTANTIRFTIPGVGPFPIDILSQLPVITESVILDGFTQPGASANTLTNGNNAVVQIILSGERSGGDVLRLQGNQSTVRGLSIVRPGASSSGVAVLSGTGHRVEGCFLGLLTDGSTPRGASLNRGVTLDGVDVTGNTVGGVTPAARNVISGNGAWGVYVLNAPSNTIAGNFIGTDRTGGLSRPNTNDGIYISGASAVGNMVGGTNAAARNVISGNSSDPSFTFGQHGIEVDLASATTIQGNYIGTDVTGTSALPNGQNGIQLDSAPTNVIGGALPALGNLISGNHADGIEVNFGSSWNLIEGNQIGVNALVTQKVPNEGMGISVSGGRDNLIMGNVLAGNESYGIGLIATPGPLASVTGNFIGTDRTGSLALGNGVVGVYVSTHSSRVEGNVIANNGSDGVFVGFGQSNVITANSIFSNASLGIDLNGSGVQLNDFGDGDTGANLGQNFPVITDALRTAASTSIGFTLSSATNQAFRVEFFDNTECDPSGFGEGRTYLGFTNITTDGSGQAAGVYVHPSALTNGHFITATATDLGGNTSEFSACRKVVPIDSVDLVIASHVASANPVPLASNLVYTVIVGNAGPTNATGVVLTDRLPAGMTFLSAVPSQGSCSQAAGVVTCSFGTVNRGSSATVLITGRPTIFGTVSNFVSVAAVQLDHTPENNSNHLLTSAGVADIFVAISDNPDPATAGQPLSYTVTVVNLGPDSAPGVGLSFSVNNEFCPQTASVTQGSFLREFNNYDVQFGTILKDGFARLMVTGLPTETGPLDSFANGFSAVADQVFDNNFVDASTSVLPGAGVLRFDDTDFFVVEDDGVGVVTVRRSGGAVGTVTARYATGNGSALAGADYTSASGTLTFTNGELQRVFIVPLLNDTNTECNETVMLSLFQATGGAVVCIETNATLTILDNDLLLNGELTLVSVNTNQPPGSGNGYSDRASISSDGRFVAFHSFARDLAPGDNGFNFEVYVRDLASGSTMRVAEGDFANRRNPVISGNGHYVAYEVDENILRHERQTGSNEIVSVRHAGGASFGYSSEASISSNGMVIAYTSEASDLVPADNNFSDDVFVRDMATGTNVLVSVNLSGTGSGNGYSTDPMVSANGRHVAFFSYAGDLVAGDTNGMGDVFARDLLAPTNRLVSVNRFGTGPGNGFSHSPRVSADGRYVGFISEASDLVLNDTNQASDVFLRDMVAGTTTLVSVNRLNNGSAAGPSDVFSLSASGRRVAFSSYADDLVFLDTAAALTDVFVRDLNAGTTTLVSINCPGTASGNDTSENPVISGDGNSVCFQSRAGDLVGGDFTGVGFAATQLYRRDLNAGVTEVLSYHRGRTGGGNGYSFDPAPSFDGRTVAFSSEANDLVENDGNFTTDVFAWSSAFAPPEPRPLLTITRQGEDLILTWPSPSTGYVLEFTDDLTPIANWLPVGAAVLDNGMVRTVTLPINFNLDARFFQLKK